MLRSHANRRPLAAALAVSLAMAGALPARAENPTGCSQSALGVTLACSPTTAHIGDTLTYSMAVGNGFAIDPTVCDQLNVHPKFSNPADLLAGNFTIDFGNKGTLVSGSSILLEEQTYQVRALDIREFLGLRFVLAQIEATAQVDAPGQPQSSASQTISTIIVQPSIQITRSCQVVPDGSGGYLGEATVQITNTGDVDLLGIAVTDNAGTPAIPGDDIDPGFATTLAKGASATRTYTFPVVGPVHTSTVRVTGTDGFLTSPGNEAAGQVDASAQCSLSVPTFAVTAITPNQADAGGTGFTLVVDGQLFPTDAAVLWNGSPRDTTWIDSTRLEALIPASDLAISADIATVLVRVRQTDGTESVPASFTIVSGNVTTSQSNVVPSGQIVQVSTAPTSSGTGGVTAQASNAGDTAPITVAVANYSTNPTSGTVFDAGGGFVDVQVTGADPADSVLSHIYYPSTVTGASETSLQLLYYTGSAWAPVLSSGGLPPDKNTTDNLDGTVSGGRFAVVFDNTSTPKVTELTGTVFVPVDGAKPLITGVAGPLDPLPVNSDSTLHITYSATGPASAHEFQLTWGDGSVETLTPTTYGTLAATHRYTLPGVYTVDIQLTDQEGNEATARFEYVVVFDGRSGYVTGGGEIESPAGAYRPDTSLNGTASFGFVARYRKGSTIPGGATEFQLLFTGFAFQSTAYDWLVLSGARAQFKGTGTINGTGNFGFLLTVTDGQLSGGGGADKFRIKIWDKTTSQIVYDNAYGSPDDLTGADATALRRGSIVIRR